MSFVLNRNVKEAKVINYNGGNINVVFENNKTINLGSISNNNSIEMNNLKKVYLIKIGQKNNNGKNIFLVAATKKFNETQVMQENIEEKQKIVMTNANYNLLSQSKSKINNPTSNNNEEELIPYKNMSEIPVETKEINFGNATRESNEKIKESNKNFKVGNKVLFLKNARSYKGPLEAKITKIKKLAGKTLYDLNVTGFNEKIKMKNIFPISSVNPDLLKRM